jgi:urea transport system ATP-binding protein
MTPELMKQGAARLAAARARDLQNNVGSSGGRSAGYGVLASSTELDIRHGRILYVALLALTALARRR